MKKKDPNILDMSKYLKRDILIKVCKDVCVLVRERIRSYYAARHIKFDGMYSGECNRAALLFHIYFFKELKDKQFEILKNCTFGEDGRPNYHLVNMHNVQALCAIDPLAMSEITIDFIHGEIAHRTDVPEEYWVIEHTWICVQYKNIKIYCDPTCGQFKSIFPYIPEYYVSTKKPVWFLADEDNPVWNKKLNNDQA